MRASHLKGPVQVRPGLRLCLAHGLPVPGRRAPRSPGLAPAVRPARLPLPRQPPEPQARARGPRERSAAAAAAAPAPAAHATTRSQPARSPLARPGLARLRGPPARPSWPPPWSCWPQLSAPLAPWTTTAPPRRATLATRGDTCLAGELGRTVAPRAQRVGHRAPPVAHASPRDRCPGEPRFRHPQPRPQSAWHPAVAAGAARARTAAYPPTRAPRASRPRAL